MWVDGKSGGSGGGATIEYVGQVTATGAGTAATTVNLASGTYARDDYAELTADNFIIVPKRGTTNLTTETSERDRTGNTYYHVGKGTMGMKNHEYTPSTGTLKFYGSTTIEEGYYDRATAGTYTSKLTAYIRPTWKIYVVKPGISTFES